MLLTYIHIYIYIHTHAYIHTELEWHQEASSCGFGKTWLLFDIWNATMFCHPTCSHQPVPHFWPIEILAAKPARPARPAIEPQTRLQTAGRPPSPRLVVLPVPKCHLQGPEIHRNPQCSAAHQDHQASQKKPSVCFNCASRTWHWHGLWSQAMGLQEGLQLVMEVLCHLWRAAFGQEWHEPHPLAGTSWILIYGHLLESMGIVQILGPFQNLEENCLRLLTCDFNLLFPLWS